MAIKKTSPTHTVLAKDLEAIQRGFVPGAWYKRADGFIGYVRDKPRWCNTYPYLLKVGCGGYIYKRQFKDGVLIEEWAEIIEQPMENNTTANSW